MAKKHNIAEDKIAEMEHFKSMANKDHYDKIVNKEILPTIDIAGHTLYFDVLQDKVHLKDDIWSSGIMF